MANKSANIGCTIVNKIVEFSQVAKGVPNNPLSLNIPVKLLIQILETQAFFLPWSEYVCR